MLPLDLDVLLLYQSTLLGVLNNDGECDVCSVGVLSAELLHGRLPGKLAMDVQASRGVLLAGTDMSTGEIDEDERGCKRAANPSLLEPAGGITTLEND